MAKPAKAKSGNMLGIVAAIVLFLIVLFMLPKMVGGARDLCNSRGYRNATDGLCTCVSGYHGEACEYSKAFEQVYRACPHMLTTGIMLSSTEHCPFGKSWFSKPLVNNERNMELVPCSNMVSKEGAPYLLCPLRSLQRGVMFFCQGSCNPFNGYCTCRPGFEGSACERSKTV
jgi:hypothetical protein